MRRINHCRAREEAPLRWVLPCFGLLFLFGSSGGQMIMPVYGSATTTRMHRTMPFGVETRKNHYRMMQTCRGFVGWWRLQPQRRRTRARANDLHVGITWHGLGMSVGWYGRGGLAALLERKACVLYSPMPVFWINTNSPCFCWLIVVFISSEHCRFPRVWKNYSRFWDSMVAAVVLCFCFAWNGSSRWKEAFLLVLRQMFPQFSVLSNSSYDSKSHKRMAHYSTPGGLSICLGSFAAHHSPALANLVYSLTYCEWVLLECSFP